MSHADILLHVLKTLKTRAAAITNRAIHDGYRPNGICSQMEDEVNLFECSYTEKLDAKVLFHEIMEGSGQDWPGHSGCYVYPVPCMDEEWAKKMWGEISADRQSMYAGTDELDDDYEPVPVPFEECPKSGLAEMAFDHLPQKYFWDANHPYGKARLEFLDHLIECVQNHNW